MYGNLGLIYPPRFMCPTCEIAKSQVFNQCRKLDDYFIESDNRGIEQWFKVELVSALRQDKYHGILVHGHKHDLSFRSHDQPHLLQQIELKAGSYRGNAGTCFRQLIDGVSQNPGIDCLFLGRFREDEGEQDIRERFGHEGRCIVICLGQVSSVNNWWIGHLRRPDGAASVAGTISNPSPFYPPHSKQ